MSAAMTTVDTTPRRSVLDREIAARLAATEYARWNDCLQALTEAQLTLPTDNAEWDVRAMVGHVVGMTEMAASTIETVRQQSQAKAAARRSGAPTIDELTAVQVRKHAGEPFDRLQARMKQVGPRAARHRIRTPGFMRARTMPERFHLPGTSEPEAWTFGFLLYTILTRDPWMHRADLSAATGSPMHLTEDHDAVLVADVVAEWAARHGQPCALTLTGAAGGSWSFGSGGPLLELDAVDFCRTVSGRRPADGLLTTHVPF
jgi:uncharacterized protein (TIGR03083 family)